MSTMTLPSDVQATIDREKDRAALQQLTEEYAKKMVAFCIATARQTHPSAATWNEHNLCHVIRSLLIGYRLDLGYQIDNEVLRQIRTAPP